jgi:hypothetical protein
MIRNTVSQFNTPNTVVITDKEANQINIVQPTTTVIEVGTPGPRGIQGEPGSPGPSGSLFPSNSGSFEISGSLLVSSSFSVVGTTTITGSILLINGSYSGSGANLFNIPASAIVGLNLSQIATGSVTASVNTTSDLFLLKSASVEMFKVQSDKVVVLASSSVTPTAVEGGIFYSASGDFFFGS